jgi:hypothetical protein
MCLQRAEAVQVSKQKPTNPFLPWINVIARKDQSLGMIMSTLHRLETKLENLPSAITGNIHPITGHILQAVEALRQMEAVTSARRSSQAVSQTRTPSITGQIDLEGREHPDFLNTTDSERVRISFSQHGVVLWPGARSILPERFLAAYERLGKSYVIDAEINRPPLPMSSNPFLPEADEHWLDSLPINMIKGLSDAFFATFNPFTPIMDEEFFLSFTLPAVIKNGFGYTIETCIVLNVMALGCFAVQAYEEGNLPLPGSVGHHFDPPDWARMNEENPPGLRFFNEGRKRMGFLMCGNDLPHCQYYLLSV